MSSSDDFDEFYVGTRDRLLLECYALTGDLRASSSAVRDAFVVTWHHWRAAVRSGSPEEWTRPHAHAGAVRRHTTRPWRKEGLADDDRRTRAALMRLPSGQRRVLVMSHLSPLSLDAIARLLGVTRGQAEHRLQAASVAFARHRDVPSTAVRLHLAHLGTVTSQVTWPPAETLRRAGTRRRRTHALVGVAAAAVALVGSGALVSGGPAKPAGFDREEGTTGAVATAAEPTAVATLEPSSLLRASQVERFDPKATWRATTTNENLEGDGRILPCQAERFADPDGEGALVRRFTGGKQARAAELVELSGTVRSARRAFRTARDWYAGCTASRTQLVSTHEVGGVGDEADLFVLRQWGSDPASLAVGVARTGRVTVTTAVRLPDGTTQPATAAAGLAAAVNRLCGTAGAGTCSAPPREQTTAPLPTGTAPGMLSAVDLPPVANAKGPWVGTDPEPARDNVASTRCDNTSFVGGGLRHNKTRTFLFPQNSQADAFGLTQTVARTPSDARARAFVAEVRQRITRCGQADLGTDVETLVNTTSKDQDLTVWALRIELSDDRVLEFWMAIMRDRSAVSQLGFVSETGLRMSREDFTATAQRALARLSELPAGSSGR